jgi:hypothetical protein
MFALLDFAMVPIEAIRIANDGARPRDIPTDSVGFGRR